MTDHYLAEQDAWAALMVAHKDWRRRQAPSWGARAKAVARMLLYPPTYISLVEAYIALFLAEDQMSERYGFVHKHNMLSEVLGE